MIKDKRIELEWFSLKKDLRKMEYTAFFVSTLVKRFIMTK
jgi:hypothetical protein